MVYHNFKPWSMEDLVITPVVLQIKFINMAHTKKNHCKEQLYFIRHDWLPFLYP